MYFYHKGERLEMYRIALKISKKQNTQFEKNIIQGYGPQYVPGLIQRTTMREAYVERQPDKGTGC